LRLALVAAAFAGCIEHRTVEVLPNVADGDLVVAYVAAEGQIRDVAWFLAGGEAPRLSVSNDETIHAFAIASGDLEDPSGATFDGGLAGDVRIYVGERPAEHGACGRCTGATFEPPQILRPGDECPPPPFARHTGDPSLADPIRIGVRGGACCTLHDPREGDPIELEPIGGDDAWPHDVATIAGGSVGLFAERRSVILNAGGRVTLDRPFSGFVLSAEGRGSSFFVVSRDDDARAALHRVDASGGIEALDHGLVPMRARPLPDGRLLVLGEDDRASAAALLCEGDRANDPCSPIVAGPPPFLDRSMVDALVLDDGTLVLAALTGFVLIEAVPDSAMSGAIVEASRTETEARGTIGPLAWRAFRPAITGDGGPVPFPPGHLRAIGTTGAGPDGSQVLLACLQDRRAILAAAPIARATVTSTLPMFRVAHEGSICRTITRDIDAPDAARAIFADGAAARIHADLRVDGTSYAPPGIDGPVHGIRRSSEGTIAWSGASAASRVYVFDEALAEFRPAYGDAALGGIARTLLADGDAVIAVYADGRFDRITPGAVEPIRIAGLDVIDAAALDSSTPELDVVAAGTAGVPWVRRVAIERGEVTPIQAQLEDSVMRIVEAGPGLFVLALHDNRLFRLRGTVLDEIPIAWDDRSTEAIEEQPAMGRSCWISLTSSGGRVLASGCAGAIVEIEATVSRPHGAQIAMRRASQSTFIAGDDPPELASLAVCPDDALIGARGVRSAELERGRFWELGPVASPCPDPRLGRCLEPADRVTVRSTFTTGSPGELAGRPGDVIALFRSGTYAGGTVSRLSAPGLVQFPDTLTHAVAAPWGGFVAVSAFGHVVRIR
jgi:hypothetical protein